MGTLETLFSRGSFVKTATILAVGTAVPDFQVMQQDVREAVRHMFGSRVPHLERLLSIFEHSGIDRRHFCMPLEWFLVPHGAEERHRLFAAHAAELGERAVRACLSRAGLPPTAVDHVIFVTTTGIATPSIDAHLCGRLGFRSDVKRTPLWGLGCAGGAAGLSRASEYVRAFPTQCCLLVAVELCSLTFLRDDDSKSNIVAASLFADGAAAALVVGEAFPAAAASTVPAPSIAATRSHIWPDSLDVMGWNIASEGLKVVFSKDIPSLVSRTMRGLVTDLLRPNGFDLPDAKRYFLHPGGRKVLRAYEEALGIDGDGLAASERVLRHYGNMSSCTVIFVLDDSLRSADAPAPGEIGVAGALGPGFSSELLLLRF